MKQKIIIGLGIFSVLGVFLFFKFFSEESQNKIQRQLDATLGFKSGVVEVYATQPAPVRIFLGVTKLTTAESTSEQIRNYRYSYGYLDRNKNYKIDPNEKALGRKYFELGQYSQYLFFDNGE